LKAVNTLITFLAILRSSAVSRKSVSAMHKTVMKRHWFTVKVGIETLRQLKPFRAYIKWQTSVAIVFFAFFAHPAGVSDTYVWNITDTKLTKRTISFLFYYSFLAHITQTPS